MKNKVGKLICCIILFCGAVSILSIAKNMAYIKILSEFILFICNGVEKIFFTPYTLIAILIILICIKPEVIVAVAKKLSTVFVRLPFNTELRNPSEEQPLSPKDIASKDITSKDHNTEGPAFYKKLLTCTGAMSTVRFMAYAIDKPGRPIDFTHIELAKWTYGDNIMEMVSNDDLKTSVQMMASVLIQTGILTGQVSISSDEIKFIGIVIKPSAHVALEQLEREDWQMTPQVIRNRI